MVYLLKTTTHTHAAHFFILTQKYEFYLSITKIYYNFAMNLI